MSSENDVSMKSRVVTLDEQRIYNEFKAVNEKLELVIRLEERNAHLTNRVNDHEDHISRLMKKQTDHSFRISQLEDIKLQIDTILREYKQGEVKVENLKVEQVKQTTITGLGISLVKWVIAFIFALGFWNFLTVKNSVVADNKAAQQQEIKKK